MRQNRVIKGALILTAASIITRVLGFVYRIYMSNVIGAEGVGLYQLIMPIYFLCWSISASGFTTTVSKLTAQEYAKKHYGNIGRLMKQALVITVSLGTLLSVGLFLFASYVAVHIVKDPRVLMPLKILSLCFPFMAAGSCIRGYFNGLLENIVPAVSQVFEQSVRMACVYMLSAALIPRGIAYACSAAVIGIVAGEVLSFALVFIWYAVYKRKKRFVSKPAWSATQTLAFMMAGAIPLSANRVAGSLLATVENIMIPQKLQLFGGGAGQALQQYGMLSGMAMPLIYFPSAFLFSLSVSLVPAVSEAQATGDKRRIHRTASKSLLFAAVIGFCAAAIFVIFSKELGTVIYKQDLSRMLVMLGVMCPFLYMQVVLSGILNGLGYQMFIFRNSLISSAINIAFIYFLVPVKGVDGFIFGWFLSLIVTCALEIEKLRQSMDLQFDFAAWFMKPVISALAAGLSMKWVMKHVAAAFFGELWGLALSVAALGALYMAFIFATKCLTIEDIRQLFNKRQKRGPDLAPAHI